MKALIAGAGVGGLTAALALRRIGWDVEVMERAARMEPVGAGIQISPNGYRVLSALGLGEAARAVSHEPEAIQMRMGVSGRRLVDIPLKGEAERRWGAPYLQCHRADLIALLADALGPDAVRLGAEIVDFNEREDGVCVALAEGGTRSGVLLIGADGLRSTVRELMLAPAPARFTGAVAWRAVVERARLGEVHVPPGACVWAGEGRHAVTYPLGRDGALVNFVGVVEEEGWRSESWSEPGAREDVAKIFEGWTPLIGAIIEAAPAFNRWALFDRPPLQRWTSGRVALIGDACHPMAPSLAQGACQAMEDAWALAAALEAGDLAGLSRYERVRKPRTTRAQREALANLRRFHKRSPLAKAAGYAPIWAMGRFAPGFFHRRMDWLYGFDVTR